MACQKRAAIGNLDTLPRWAQMRQRQLLALDRLRVCSSHLCHVVDKHEFGEVVVDRGAREMLAGSQVVAVFERSAPEFFVIRGPQAPGGAPVVPAFDLAGYLLEISQQHAVRDKARRPVRYGRLDSHVSAHRNSSWWRRLVSQGHRLHGAKRQSGPAACYGDNVWSF